MDQYEGVMRNATKAQTPRQGQPPVTELVEVTMAARRTVAGNNYKMRNER